MRSFLAAAVTASALLAAVASPAAAQTPIQPGAAIDGENCTLGWLFDASGGAVYFATAAHCVERGATVTVDDGEPLGKVEVLGDKEEAGTDVALIRVREALLGRLSPELRGHPGIPSGVVRSDGAASGDVLQFSGYGMGFGLTEPTRERRRGLLTVLDDERSLWRGLAPNSGGDSGGPVAHVAGGAALGLVKGVSCGSSPEHGFECSGWGPSISGIEKVAAAAGVSVRLRAVGGPVGTAPAPSSTGAPQDEQPAAPGPSASASSSPSSADASAARCADTVRPTVRIASIVVRGGRVRVRGSAADAGCGARVARTQVALVRGKAVPPFARAGATRWSFSSRRLRAGRWTLVVRSTDAAGNRTEVRRTLRVR